ncbi:unnamed protein product [Bursaphelenchus xylophilus]|uniref:(pine wood nematode) hypothetical protein n=1 Tax=Bursaphelenchus xylophilus TaxID=6326 RepID=A0A1I7S8Z8_BURXY|nr:unnamed protein product [Bursaphelenchus xylophilus]CAG9086068.1 unnamed protein product [Bursaphelenchus xylophilus]
MDQIGDDQASPAYLLRRANSGLDNLGFSNFDLRACSISCPSTSRYAGNAETGSNECFTVWEPVFLRQEWTINNIKAALELTTPGICMRSRAFKDESMPDISWQLCLYPGGKREENKNNVSLFLKMSTSHASKEFTVRAEYCFYFMDDNNKSKFNNVNTGDFKVKPTKGSHSWGLRNIPRAKVINSVRSDDSLHIVCEIQTVPDFNRVPPVVYKKESPINQSQLMRDFVGRFHDMYETGEGSDFVIECQGREFAVHKFVLMAHSEVLRAMFKHSMEETKNGRMKLLDACPEAVAHMLYYMYSGALPQEFEYEHASPLMQIADKYALDQLKMLCQEKLIQRLNASNVITMLIMADYQNAPLLMDACIPVIKANSRRIISSPDWNTLKTNNQKLVNSVLEKIVVQDDSPPQKRLRLTHSNQMQR